MKLKHLIFAVLGLLLFTGSLFAENSTPKPKMKHKMFQSVSMDQVTVLQKGDAKMFCPVCGMNLPMFYKTNHVADVNGTTKQYCSLHCLVEEKEIHKSDLQNIRVVDAKSLTLIPAQNAFYVVGSSKKGTMTMVSKYAFASKADAESFAKENGGTVMDFTSAYAEAKKDFPKDNKMIGKKQAMMAAMGEKLYKTSCTQTTEQFSSPALAKAYVIKHKLCSALNPKQLQAIGLYLSRR